MGGPTSIGGPIPTGTGSAAGGRGTATGAVHPAPDDVGSGPRWSTTHVSFEPPPWLELTTSPPSWRATRVRPPGRTHTRSPSLTANGRKSTCRGAMPPPTHVGDVDRATMRWATHDRGDR